MNPAMAIKLQNFIYLSYEPIDLVVVCFFASLMALIFWKMIRGKRGRGEERIGLSND